MPYQPVALGPHVSAALRQFVRQQIDDYFSEFRFLLSVENPNQGPKGSLQRPLAALILVAADGAAKFLHPGRMRNGDRFRTFLMQNCPWELDQPEGLTIEEACDFLWRGARCPLAHAFGVTSAIEQQARPMLKLGRVFVNTDESLDRLESTTHERPFSDPTIRRNAHRTVIWIESFYWCKRWDWTT